MEKQTFYLVRQESFTHNITVERIKRANKYETAIKLAFGMVPAKTDSFMVVEEEQAKLLIKDLEQATRHLIGEDK